MKIGYLVPEFPGQTHAFFWREINAMEETGSEIHVFSTRKPPDSACPHEFRETAAARTRYLFPPSPGRAMRWLAVRPHQTATALGYVGTLSETPLSGRTRLLALIASAADLAATCAKSGVTHVHIHSCANAAHLGALAQILDGPSYSLTLHGNLPVYGSDHAAKLAQASFASAVTRPLAEEIRQVRPDIATPVIMMGVDTERFRPAADRTTRASGDPLHVVSVARLNHTKGHRFFLRAMAEAERQGTQIHYRIAGDGPERPAINAEIARLGLAERVTLLGPVSEEAVLDLLQSADALALTSIGHGEAAPVAVMEAMACGLPVIASVIGGTPDMITDRTDSFLVLQEDTAAITRALLQLAQDPDAATRIGQAARQTALEKFDHRTNAGRLLDEIRSRIS